MNEKSQRQHSVEVNTLGKTVRKKLGFNFSKKLDIEVSVNKILNGVATGNNAAWLCYCGYKKPLIGRSDPDYPVVCGGCGARYEVWPEDDEKLKRVEYVQEISKK